MSVECEVFVGVAIALIVGAIAWLARLIFLRPQQALAGALSGPPIASEVQTRMDQMSDVPVLEGPTSYTFTAIDPRQVPDHDLPLGVTEWQNWAYEHGGEDVETTIVQVTLQGLTRDPISIEAPVLSYHDVLDRRSAERFGPGGLGGGGVMPRHYTFQISGQRVDRQFDEEHDRPEAFQLGEGETERIIIKIQVNDSSRHEWDLRIPYVRRGKREHLEVRHPTDSKFVTTGAAGLEHWFHDDGWFKAGGQP